MGARGGLTRARPRAGDRVPPDGLRLVSTPALGSRGPAPADILRRSPARRDHANGRSFRSTSAEFALPRPRHLLWISAAGGRGAGYRGRMIARLASSALAAAALCAIVSGCSAPAEPVEPTPVFTSEKQAFAAAEETYRAYVDALNAVDLSDPETFEDVFAWTTGEANAGARETFSQMHADGWTVSGSTIPTEIELSQVDLSAATVELSVCTNIASVDVVDSDGQSVVEPDRGDTQSMTVALTASSTATGLAVSSLTGRTGEPTCD